MTNPGITLLPVTQATGATFAGLYLERALLVFIRTGWKRVECPVGGELIGQACDLMIFPPGSMVTMENRPSSTTANVPTHPASRTNSSVRTFQGSRSHPAPSASRSYAAMRTGPAWCSILSGDTLDTLGGLPEAIYRHRLLEPLVWLKEAGVRLTLGGEDHPLATVRRLVETDLAHSWHAAEAAAPFAMSEATFRRWLTRSGLGFSGILSNSRLQHGLGLLQTTADPISQIALECGFKTPSHFSEAFRARFGITPRAARASGSCFATEPSDASELNRPNREEPSCRPSRSPGQNGQTRASAQNTIDLK